MKFVVLVTVVTLVFGQDQNWENECLKAQNQFRATQGKPRFVLNSTLIAYAQKWANHLSATCGMEHSRNPDYGENLAFGNPNCADSVRQWTSEQSNYNPSNPVFAYNTGHFTQVDWLSTTDVGCGISTHCEYQWVTVCEYWPPGNMEGEFTKNV